MEKSGGTRSLGSVVYSGDLELQCGGRTRKPTTMKPEEGISQ